MITPKQTMQRDVETRDGHAPPVANRATAEDGHVPRIRVTFDARPLLYR